MGLVNRFKDELARYLSRCENPSENMLNLIKFENGDAAIDFSVPRDLKIWENYIDIKHSDKYNNNILMYATEVESSDECQGIASCEKESEKFIFQIKKVEACGPKFTIKLARNTTFEAALHSISSCDYGKQRKIDETFCINNSELENSPITCFRLETIALVLKNLLDTYSQYSLATDETCADHKILLTTQSNPKKSDSQEDQKVVLCAVVIDETSRKISHQSTEEYIKKRTDDMHLMAIHKYGVRIKNDENFLELRDKLGYAACKLDMMEVKNSNPLTPICSTKQAFILYNSARIETLLKTFDEMVLSGYYPKLPELKDIDLNLLSTDEEWRLLKHLLLFPETVQHACGDFKAGRINVHLVYRYLQSFATEFSNYYAKKKILTENRPQLIPVMHAKIHLLKAVQSVFNRTLEIFDIEPVSFM